jgi:CheY-like chemotaxis protein
MANSYDLIFMDENMPNLNGREAAKKILELRGALKLPKVPIVALTANALKGDREKFIEAGMDDYLTKPINKDEIIRALCTYLPNNDSNDACQITP